jgi:N-acyl-D-amino-acid deacylase
MMVKDAAKLHGKSRPDTILDVLMADDLASTEISFSMCDEDVETVMAHPRVMIGTDGLWYPGTMGAHPRAFASFPRVLGHYVRERKVVSFEEAIRKMTSMPAAVYGLQNKGMIREGFDADLCLLDPDVIIDAADYKNWNARCPGLKHVLVAGEIVVTDSVHDGRLLGKKLLRSW